MKQNATANRSMTSDWTQTSDSARSLESVWEEVDWFDDVNAVVCYVNAAAARIGRSVVALQFDQFRDRDNSLWLDFGNRSQAQAALESWNVRVLAERKS